MSGTVKNIHVTFIKKETFLPGYYGFYFLPKEQFNFSAGQYIQLILPHATPDDLGTSRYFSISSAPHEAYLLITTKIPRDGETVSSLKQTLLGLTEGSIVQLVGPMGKFVLEED
jgi:ferredoxin-NADP reductase